MRGINSDLKDRLFEIHVPAFGLRLLCVAECYLHLSTMTSCLISGDPSPFSRGRYDATMVETEVELVPVDGSASVSYQLSDFQKEAFKCLIFDQ